MNQGLAILMERIDTHPEEFIGRSSVVAHISRWGTLIDIAADIKRSGTFITVDERAALLVKLSVVRGEQFHKEVLRSLMLDPAVDDSSDHTPDAARFGLSEPQQLAQAQRNFTSNESKRFPSQQ